MFFPLIFNEPNVKIFPYNIFCKNCFLLLIISSLMMCTQVRLMVIWHSTLCEQAELTNCCNYTPTAITTAQKLDLTIALTTISTVKWQIELTASMVFSKGNRNSNFNNGSIIYHHQEHNYNIICRNSINFNINNAYCKIKSSKWSNTITKCNSTNGYRTKAKCNNITDTNGNSIKAKYNNTKCNIINTNDNSIITKFSNNTVTNGNSTKSKYNIINKTNDYIINTIAKCNNNTKCNIININDNSTNMKCNNNNDTNGNSIITKYDFLLCHQREFEHLNDCVFTWLRRF